jgi:hypothetical protein
MALSSLTGITSMPIDKNSCLSEDTPKVPLVSVLNYVEKTSLKAEKWEHSNHMSPMIIALFQIHDLSGAAV